VYFGLGYLYWKSNQLDQAKHAFETQLSIEPGNAQSLAYLGDVYLKRNDAENALTYLRKAVQAKPEVRIAYLDLGAVLSEQKQYKDAVAPLQRAVELDPSRADAHYRLGRVYKALGNSEAAEQEFKKVQELHRKSDEDVASKMSSGMAAQH
jgi:tetratricopeptide (TPR) repeat protein